MIIDLSGKIAVVTGGTSGIGLEGAKALGKSGAKVAICGTNYQKLQAALEILKKEKIEVYGGTCDVADLNSLFRFADEVEKNLGIIDTWVSNAGIYPQYKLIDTPDDVWQRTIDVNMKSVCWGGKVAYRNMRQKGGVLVNASSFAALMPSVGSGLYAATKAAVSSMTRTLAAELAPHNIRVCGYIPGLIDTAITHPLIEKDGDLMRKTIALNRAGTAEEVGNILPFLVSDYASYIAGSCIEIHGGKFCVQNPGSAWQEGII